MADKSNKDLLNELRILHEEHESLKLLYRNKIDENLKSKSALAESEENLRLLLELAPDAFFQGDAKGNFMMANRRAIDFSGYSLEEMLNMNMKQLFSSSELNQKPLRYDLLDKGEVITAEREIIRKDGSTVIVEMTSRKMPNGTYQSFMRDISERKRSELAIKESERLYRTIFENTGTASIIIDADTTILLTNSEWVNLAGYSREEMEGKMSWTNFVEAEDLVRMREYHNKRRINPDGAPSKYEFKFIRRNGEIRHMIIVVAMIPESKKSIASLMDITELKHAEKALKDRELRLGTIIETSPDSIAISALDGTVQFVTQKTLSLWGYDFTEELIGKNVLDFIDKDYRDKATYFISEMIKGNLTGVAEYVMVRKDGRKFYCESNANVLNDANNNPIGILYINRDITQRKEVENELIRAKEIAEESESRFRLIFENAPLGIIHYNSLGEILSCNDKFVEIIGSSKNVLIGLNMQVLPDKKVVEALNKSLNGTIGYYDDEYHSTTANKVTPVQIVFAPIFSNSNKVIGGVGIIEDVTNRKRNEQQLKKQNEEYLALNEELQQTNEELYRAKKMVEENEAFLFNIFENIPNMVFVKKADDLSFVKFNKAGEELLGYKREDLLGKNDYDFFPKEQADSFTLKDREVFEEGNILVVEEEEVETKHGKRILYTKKIAIKDSTGINKYLLGISEDITKRKEIENELVKAKEKAEESEEKYKTMVSILPDGVIIHQAGNIVYANDSAKRIVKADQNQDLLGMPALGFVHPDYREIALNRIKESFIHKTPAHTIEELFVRFDGETINVLVTAFPFQYEGKSSMLTVFTDITSIKQVESELLKAKEKAEESDRLKSAFLANMSHEIRTPMNGILGFAGLLKQPQLSGEQQKEYISIIEKSGARMLSIINDIVDIAKIESGQMQVSLSQTNIEEQLKYLHEFFKPEADKKGLTLVLKRNVHPNEAFVNTDSEKLYAILTNLIKNAIKFTEKGFVEIEYSKKANHFEFSIKDTGIGIPKNRIEAVFERFIQADIGDKRAYQGAGLGLSITKAFVEMLGGRIWVESDELIGSTFYFTIPFTNEINTQVEVKRVTSEKAETISAPDLKVLIAEDDEASDMLITLMLSNLNFEILHAKNGVDAVNVCKNTPDLDLILMDIKMPELDGYEATEQIRQFNRSVIIIAQTAHALTGDKEKALNSGCNEYITKPINYDLLKTILSKYF